MRRVYTKQRANHASKYNMLSAHSMQLVREWQDNIRRDGKGRKLTVLRCGCGVRHWGRRKRFLINKQKVVNNLCNHCFKEKYGKNRPPKIADFVYRNLSIDEIEGLNRYYEATGVKISNLDND